MKPKLDRPAPHWKQDLPEPNNPSESKIDPLLMSSPPNHYDEVYMELARSTLRVRGVAIWGAIIGVPMALVLVCMMVDMLLFWKRYDLELLALEIGGVVVIIWSAVYLWRLDTTAPRDEPIRFNRARRKVYVYRFYHNGLFPFSRTSWYCCAEAYNWDDLRAEYSSFYGPGGNGGFIESISLAVVVPGTNKVLDRFHFAHGGQQGEMYWAMAQRFMQQGPDSIPTFEYLPRDWNNEDVTLNLARYLAPKVKWPEDMDIESRTAPSGPG
jgi:hypothetical protein